MAAGQHRKVRDRLEEHFARVKHARAEGTVPNGLNIADVRGGNKGFQLDQHTSLRVGKDQLCVDDLLFDAGTGHGQVRHQVFVVVLFLAPLDDLGVVGRVVRSDVRLDRVAGQVLLQLSLRKF